MVLSATTSSPTASTGTVPAAKAIVEAAEAGGVRARLLGGLAIAIRCQSARDGGPLARSYSDVDIITSRQGAKGLARALEQLGYEAEARFNAVHGHSRMMFAHPRGPHVDVFIDRFVMCHSLGLADRLTLHDTTLSLADLLLTKLQVAQLNAKDVTDASALLLDHPLSDDETGINADYICRLLCQDWGWWRTMTENLEKVTLHSPADLTPQATATVTRQIGGLLAAIERAPKRMRWRARAKAGDRVPWRDEPEESH